MKRAVGKRNGRVHRELFRGNHIVTQLVSLMAARNVARPRSYYLINDHARGILRLAGQRATIQATRTNVLGRVATRKESRHSFALINQPLDETYREEGAGLCESSFRSASSRLPRKSLRDLFVQRSNDVGTSRCISFRREKMSIHGSCDTFSV